MPMYDFECDCGQQFEAIRRINERDKAQCPYCFSEARQMLTAPAGINGGFYDNSVRVNRQKQTFKSSVR
ncbi:zinc ribbon domain-containing protein [Pantoea ananatis]|uniref:FmdB family zinc ribbon protein n=1 Tax=Pantoea ananas TaxID=553 RepID=UPI003529E1A3